MTIPTYGVNKFGLVTEPHSEVFAPDAFCQNIEPHTEALGDTAKIPVTAAIGNAALADVFRTDSSLDHIM